MTFLQKSYGVEKPVLVMMSYEGLDHEEEFKTFPIVNNNNIVNVVSDSYRDDDIENKTIQK